MIDRMDQEPAHERPFARAATADLLRDQQFVVAIWDDARTARLSDLFYGEMIQRWSWFIFWSDFVIALAASGSGIAAWHVWQSNDGSLAWALLSGIAAMMSIARPLLRLDRRIRDGSAQQQSYRELVSSLETLVLDVQQDGRVSAGHRRRYQVLRDRLRAAQDADVANPSVARRERIQEAVIREMPAEVLWIPSAPLMAAE